MVRHLHAACLPPRASLVVVGSGAHRAQSRIAWTQGRVPVPIDNDLGYGRDAVAACAPAVLWRALGPT